MDHQRRWASTGSAFPCLSGATRAAGRKKLVFLGGGDRVQDRFGYGGSKWVSFIAKC